MVLLCTHNILLFKKRNIYALTLILRSVYKLKLDFFKNKFVIYYFQLKHVFLRRKYFLSDETLSCGPVCGILNQNHCWLSLWMLPDIKTQNHLPSQPISGYYQGTTTMFSKPSSTLPVLLNIFSSKDMPMILAHPILWTAQFWPTSSLP